MPVTVKPATHDASYITAETNDELLFAQGFVKSDGSLLQRRKTTTEAVHRDEKFAIQVMPTEHASACKFLFQSSLSIQERSNIITCKNGFVGSVLKAYAKHHHLRIRPDDVWQAILTQINFYINAHAEALRSSFVKHNKKKGLHVAFESAYRIDEIPFDRFAKTITETLGRDLVDKELKEWILPTFTTTTDTDVICASITMMATLQRYYEYYAMTACGLPSVTLLGEKSDWEIIMKRLDKLTSWGKEPEHFATVLKPILRHILLTFDDPEVSEVVEFWSRIVTNTHEGSGEHWCRGWITAFVFWDASGQCCFDQDRDTCEAGKSSYRYHYEEAERYSLDLGQEYNQEQGQEYSQKAEQEDRQENEQENHGEDEKSLQDMYCVQTQYGSRLVIDGVQYGLTERCTIPGGFVSVPVTIQHDRDYPAMMVAGSAAMVCSSSHSTDPKDHFECDTLAPHMAWWSYLNGEAAEHVYEINSHVRRA